MAWRVRYAMWRMVHFHGIARSRQESFLAARSGFGDVLLAWLLLHTICWSTCVNVCFGSGYTRSYWWNLTIEYSSKMGVVDFSFGVCYVFHLFVGCPLTLPGATISFVWIFLFFVRLGNHLPQRLGFPVSFSKITSHMSGSCVDPALTVSMLLAFHLSVSLSDFFFCRTRIHEAQLMGSRKLWESTTLATSFFAIFFWMTSRSLASYSSARRLTIPGALPERSPLRCVIRSTTLSAVILD